MSRTRGPLFTELETLWYRRLKQEGFRDIEKTSDPDRPLVTWHSAFFRQRDLRFVQRMHKNTEYIRKCDELANHPQFPRITQTLSAHGNAIFTAQGIATVWDMHREGKSERRIAHELSVSRSCITFLLRRIRAWMELL